MQEFNNNQIELIVVDYVNQIPNESDNVLKKVVNFNGFCKDHQVKAFERLQEEKNLYPGKEFVIYTVNDHYSMMATEVLNNTYLIDLRTKQLDESNIMDEVITFVDGVKSGEINLGTEVRDIKISNLPQFINMLTEYFQTTGEFTWVINKIMKWNLAYLKYADKESIITSLLLSMCDYTLKYTHRDIVPYAVSNMYKTISNEWKTKSPQFNKPEEGWKF